RPGQYAGRLVAAARIQHPGGPGGALRERQRGGPRTPDGGPQDCPVGERCRPAGRRAVRPPLMRFFFYGTLLDHDVASLVLGRRLPPNAYVPSALPGHARRRVRGACYPIVVRDPKREVAGAIVGGL